LFDFVRFWHAPNTPRTRDRQVNEKPFKIAINSRKSASFHPLSLQKSPFFTCDMPVPLCEPTITAVAGAQHSRNFSYFYGFLRRKGVFCSEQALLRAIPKELLAGH
jgi:hypothetical protein